jgi:GT2 family glycosyltransferase
MSAGRRYQGGEDSPTVDDSPSVTVEAVAQLSLRVQSVVYNIDRERMTRWVGALADALAQARPLLARVEVAVVDSAAEAVLDQAWRDAVAPRLTAAGVDEFELVRSERNLGHGGGQNFLLGDRLPDRLLVLNPDAFVAHDLVAEIVRASTADGVGVVEGRQLPFEHPRDYDLRTGDTSWASGACMLISGDVISAVGLFDDESFFMHGDDVDLSWRARQAGFRVIACPEALVFHDKRLGRGGHYEAPEAEVYHSAHSALMLRWKYSRPDLIEGVIGTLMRSPDPVVRGAIADWEATRDAGHLPVPIDADHQVGQFVDGAYAPHRF